MTRAPPLISVVIPSYNHAHLIGRALESVLSQSWPNLEVIVVDNHSRDDTDEVVARFGDPRVRLLKIHNEGVIAASRNVGIRAAQGQWVAFLDSDDWWTRDKLECCAAYFHEADFIYHRLRIVRADGRIRLPRCIRSWQVRAPVMRHLLVAGNPIATSSVVVRKSLLDQIGGFDERRQIVAAEDYDIWLRIARITERFLYVPAVLGFYRHSTQSASNKDMSVPVREVVAAHISFLREQERNRADAQPAYTSGRYALMQGDVARARGELVQSLRWGRMDIRLKSLISLLMLSLSRSSRPEKSGERPKR